MADSGYNPVQRIARRTPGKLATTGQYNTLAEAIEAIAPIGTHGLGESSFPYPMARSFYLTWNSGPGGEPDYTDNRYWIREAFVDNITGDRTTALKLKEAGLASPTDLNWFTATHLGERPANTGGVETAGRHDLAKGTAVMGLWLVPDKQLPTCWRFVFMVGGGAGDATAPQYQGMTRMGVAANTAGWAYLFGTNVPI